MWMSIFYRSCGQVACTGLACVTLLVACASPDRPTDPTAGDDPSATLSVVSGNHQTGIAGLPLASHLVVRLTTSAGAPVVGASIAWGGNDGTLTPSVSQTDATGLASASWSLQYLYGFQAVSASRVGVQSTAAYFDAVAMPAPLILHFDGAQWSTQLADTNLSLVQLRGITGTSTQVTTFGGSCGGVFLAVFDGTTWRPARGNDCSGTTDEFTSVSIRSATESFRVFRYTANGTALGNVDRYGGGSLTSWNLSFPLYAVWAAPATEAWTVGDRGGVSHYDGTAWSNQSSGTTRNLVAVWGSSTHQIFAAGDSGVVVAYDGSVWAPQNSRTTAALHAVQGSSPTDVFAVGASGTIVHFDGTSWTPQASGSIQDLYGLWVRSPSDVYAVGNAGTLLHYDGVRWINLDLGSPMNCRGIWGSSPTDIFVVGSVGIP
jgi:hypothetical protein